MRPVVYNINGIRRPITGIGRYAIELLRGGLQVKLKIIAGYKSELHTKKSLGEVLNNLDQSITAPSGVNWRSLIARVPCSRSFYRRFNNWSFDRLIRLNDIGSALYHDLNYSEGNYKRPDVVTVYDLSHKLYGDTHPRHRVRFLEHYFQRLADSDQRIITISNHVKAELIQIYGIAEDRINVTYLAADGEFQPRSRSECESYLSHYGLRYKQFVLCVGALEPRKNLKRLLDAYCSLDSSVQEAFPLVIAGPKGWKSQDLEDQIMQLQRQRRVIKIGFVPQHQLPILYASAATFIYPSLYEGFGLPLLEAMQSGCPTITSNSGSMAEVVDESALLVNPLSCDDIATSLNRLLQDTALRSEYSQAGLQRARDFSWDKTVEQTHKIYNDLRA